VDFQNWRDENEAGDQQEDLEEVTLVTCYISCGLTRVLKKATTATCPPGNKLENLSEVTAVITVVLQKKTRGA
jgi:hypothetical protein